MHRPTILLIALALLGTVAAQSRIESSADATYEKPGAYTYVEAKCLEKQVKALYAATDLTLDLEEQEKLLNAAEAYGQLQELSQPC